MPEQFALKCIFCGQTGVTKEHIWGRRLQKLLLRSSPNTAHVAGTGQSRELGRLHRPGDPLSQSLRVVCRSCNNGWMSGLQEASMPAMEKLVSGNWEAISDSQLAAARTAIVLTTMVAEWAHPESVGITFEERRKFFESRSAGTDWIVLVGKFRDDRHPSVVFNHFNGSGLDDDRPFSFQTTGFVLGQLLVQTLSVTFRTCPLMPQD